MGVYPEGIMGFVPEDVVACLAEEPFRWTEVKPTVYSTEDPLGSTTIMRLSDETRKNWMLEVDYQQVLDYLYVSSGTGFPLPERPYLEQIDDWKHGYMWGRFKLAPSCGTLAKRTAGFEEYGHFFWVKYYARLYELIPDPTEAVLEYELSEKEGSGALQRFQTDYVIQSEFINKVTRLLSGYNFVGWAWKDNFLRIRVKRTGSPAIWLIAGLIAKFLMSWGFKFGLLYIGKKLLDVYNRKITYDLEGKKLDYESKLNNQEFFNIRYGEYIEAGYDPETAGLLARGDTDIVRREAEQYEQKIELIKYAKYGAIGLGTLMALSLVRDIVKR